MMISNLAISRRGTLFSEDQVTAAVSARIVIRERFDQFEGILACAQRFHAEEPNAQKRLAGPVGRPFKSR